MTSVLDLPFNQFIGPRSAEVPDLLSLPSGGVCLLNLPTETTFDGIPGGMKPGSPRATAWLPSALKQERETTNSAI